MQIKAISLDFWGTLYLGNQSVKPLRIQFLYKFLRSKGARVSKERVESVYQDVRQRAKLDWINYNIHTSCYETVIGILDELHIQKGLLNKSELAHITSTFEEMTFQHCLPTLYPEIYSTLIILSQKYPLGITSDAGLTPGRVLKKILRKDSIYEYLSSFTFSDELGVTKPTSLMFETTAQSLGVSMIELLHVGDDLEKDYHGVIDCGGQAIWLNRVNNVSKDSDFHFHGTTVENLLELVEIL